MNLERKHGKLPLHMSLGRIQSLSANNEAWRSKCVLSQCIKKSSSYKLDSFGR